MADSWSSPTLIANLLATSISSACSLAGVIIGIYHNSSTDHSLQQVDCPTIYLALDKVIADHPSASIQIDDQVIERTCHIAKYLTSIESP